jgi:hypothetical protein
MEIKGIAIFCFLDNIVVHSGYLCWIDKKIPSRSHYVVCCVTSLRCFLSAIFLSVVTFYIQKLLTTAVMECGS